MSEVTFSSIGFVGSKTGQGYGYRSGKCSECAAWVPKDLDEEGDGKGWVKHRQWHERLKNHTGSY